VQKNLLKFSAHVPVSDEQDKILGAVYLPCDQLRAKKSLHAAATNLPARKEVRNGLSFSSQPLRTQARGFLPTSQ
jgi:hypothetical protein